MISKPCIGPKERALRTRTSRVPLSRAMGVSGQWSVVSGQGEPPPSYYHKTLGGRERLQVRPFSFPALRTAAALRVTISANPVFLGKPPPKARQDAPYRPYRPHNPYRPYRPADPYRPERRRPTDRCGSLRRPPRVRRGDRPGLLPVARRGRHLARPLDHDGPAAPLHRIGQRRGGRAQEPEADRRRDRAPGPLPRASRSGGARARRAGEGRPARAG